MERTGADGNDYGSVSGGSEEPNRPTKNSLDGIFFEIALIKALTCGNELLEQALEQMERYLVKCLKSGYTRDDIIAIKVRVAQQCRPKVAE